MSSKKMRLVTCGSCGAAFDRKLPACPYCGATNLWGNERKYMEGLEETRKNLGELPQGRKRALRLVWKREILVMAGIVLAVCLLLGSLYLYSDHEEQIKTTQLKEAILNDM